MYIIEQHYWRLQDTSARQWDFVAESLTELRGALAHLGQPLVIRMGDAVTELEALRRRFAITRMISHEETGNVWTYARDRQVKAWARNTGVNWIELPQSGVVRRLASRDGWQARRNAFMAAPGAATPEALAPVTDNIGLTGLPSARALGMVPDPCPHRQKGGRMAADVALASFLATRGVQYRRKMSSPLTAERACSRLSPYIAYGVISLREGEAARSAARARHQVPDDRNSDRAGDWSGSLSSFAKRLAWRDHFIQKLEDAPSIEHRCLHPAHETLRIRGSEPERLAAWQNGETGVPFVDACMRYLRATGWLNFRMRAMLMSFASYHLWLDWRDTGPHLARMFTDYEPGIHWSQCQMQSGTTGINTIRIYNPLKQGLEQDPDGRFTRAWVPELAHLRAASVHMPWASDLAVQVLDRRYPAPIVDLEAAGRHARNILWGLRGSEEFRDMANVIAQKHASRARGTDRSSAASKARARRKAVPDTRQLNFDL